MRKPKLGVCGQCGCAVVRGLDEPADGEKNGHKFSKGELVRVRCIEHGGSFEGSRGSWETSARQFPTVEGSD